MAAAGKGLSRALSSWIARTPRIRRKPALALAKAAMKDIVACMIAGVALCTIPYFVASILANWLIVFHPGGSDWLGRAGRFLATTAFSAFVLQNLILYFTTSVWKAPANAAVFLVHKLRLNHLLNDDLCARNTCKAMAVSAGLIWNFFWYKFFVYAA